MGEVLLKGRGGCRLDLGGRWKVRPPRGILKSSAWDFGGATQAGVRAAARERQAGRARRTQASRGQRQTARKTAVRGAFAGEQAGGRAVAATHTRTHTHTQAAAAAAAPDKFIRTSSLPPECASHTYHHYHPILAEALTSHSHTKRPTKLITPLTHPHQNVRH